MNSNLTRREFLKYTLATGALLASGDGIMRNPITESAIQVTPLDRITLWVLTDNYYDALRPSGTFTTRYRATPGRSIHAEHGVSYFLESLVDGRVSTCMFDFGLDPDGLMRNITLLGLDIETTNAFALSHGHFDHYMGATNILKRHRSKTSQGTPFFVGEEAFLQRYWAGPPGTEPVDLGRLRRKDIEGLGLTVVEGRTPVEIIPGVYKTGNIDRVTEYERVPSGFQVKRDGRIEHDTFPGEQALFAVVRNKGLVVLSGCAHSGIVNTVTCAQKAAGTKKIHAILGGFHLINANQEVMARTVADVYALGPDVIVPTHCTGFEAIVAFSEAMPREFVLNTAGTRYTFAA